MKNLLAQRRVQVGLAALVMIVVIAVVVGNHSSGSTSSAGTTSPTATTTSPSGSALLPTTIAPTTTAGSGPSPTDSTPTGPATATTHDPMAPFTDLPLNVSVPSTSGLSDGQTVTIHVQAKDGAKIFGAEARLCAGTAKVQNSADFAPTQGGLCIAHPLSAASDARIEVAGQDPYQTLDVAFRVGVGTDSFTMGDGTPVTIRCGPANPCVLVLKLQVPGGFGFESYPVTFG